MTVEHVKTPTFQRIAVLAEPELLAALQDHQRRLERSTNLRTSLSQVAASLLRQGLTRELQQKADEPMK